jgi:hypothetical protein
LTKAFNTVSLSHPSSCCRSSNRDASVCVLLASRLGCWLIVMRSRWATGPRSSCKQFHTRGRSNTTMFSCVPTTSSQRKVALPVSAPCTAAICKQMPQPMMMLSVLVAQAQRHNLQECQFDHCTAGTAWCTSDCFILLAGTATQQRDDSPSGPRAWTQQ